MKFFTGIVGELPDRTLATTETLKTFEEDIFYIEDESKQLRQLVAANVEVHPAFHAAVSKSLSKQPKENKKLTPEKETK